MTSAFLSIITVVRNDERGLARTAESVRLQKFRDFEWVVVDGNSTDGTRDAVLGLIASGEVTGVSEPDKGVYDAMNKGLRCSSGLYTLFLNAGDCLLDESSLETAAQELTAGGLPDIGFFGSIMDFNGRRIVREVKPPSYIWHGQPGLHQATFIKRELHQRFPFRLNYRVAGDYDALARMSASGATMKSFERIVGVNEFEADAISGRNKMSLIREAADIQRTVLGLPAWKVMASVTRRGVNSAAAKILTSIRVGRAS